MRNNENRLSKSLTKNEDLKIKQLNTPSRQTSESPSDAGSVNEVVTVNNEATQADDRNLISRNNLTKSESFFASSAEIAPFSENYVQKSHVHQSIKNKPVNF